MKLKSFALSMACVMAVALTGCSANRDINSGAPTQPTNSISADSGDRASAGINGTVQNSAGIDDYSTKNSANVDNDAAQGGGAGGINDRNNDGTPDGGTLDPDRNPSSSGNVVDDIGDAAGDLARDAGNAIGNAANDVMR